MKNKEIQNLIDKASLNPENILLLTIKNKENSIKYQSYLDFAKIEVSDKYIKLIIKTDYLHFSNEVEFSMDITSKDFKIEEFEGFEYEGDDYAYISLDGYITFKNSNVEIRIITPKF